MPTALVPAGAPTLGPRGRRALTQIVLNAANGGPTNKATVADTDHHDGTPRREQSP